MGGLQDFSVSPSPLLVVLGLGTFGFFWIGDIRVSGLGLDNYDQNEIIKHRWENPWRRLNIENSNKSDFAAKNERIKFILIK